jgi:hypothetical protein
VHNDEDSTTDDDDDNVEENLPTTLLTDFMNTINGAMNIVK